jgi:hypothetical protein
MPSQALPVLLTTFRHEVSTTNGRAAQTRLMDAVAKANAQHEKAALGCATMDFRRGCWCVTGEYSEAEYSQLGDYHGRTPVNLMMIGEKKWWSDGVQSLVLDVEHIAERGTEYQVFLHDTKPRKLLGILGR